MNKPQPKSAPPAVIRAGRDADADGFTALMAACWAEYPGMVFEADKELPELRALASFFTAKGGVLWAAEANGSLVGMIATYPLTDKIWEISRMYVARERRGGELAGRLLDRAEAHARAAGATRLTLWTDTRFDRAHGFYEKRSYVRSGPVRVLDDLSHSIEFVYAKPVAGIERLDAAAALSAERSLAALLRACVAAGAAVSFLPPLSSETARAFWHDASAAVAAGTRILLAAWSDAELIGSVTLNLATPPNQRHRADVQKLLVHPAARRQGIGRALMLRAEEEALAANRALLTLDTRAGDAGEALYRATGWSEVGRIPGYSLEPDGSCCDAVFFYKQLTA